MSRLILKLAWTPASLRPFSSPSEHIGSGGRDSRPAGSKPPALKKDEKTRTFIDRSRVTPISSTPTSAHKRYMCGRLVARAHAMPLRERHFGLIVAWVVENDRGFFGTRNVKRENV